MDVIVYVCVSLLEGSVSEDLVREVRRRQRAVVALVFNFAPPSRSSRDDPLLSLHEVTLEGFMRDPVVVHLTMYVCM